MPAAPTLAASLTFLIMWRVVPIIIASFFFSTLWLVGKSASATAGLMFGILLFVVYLVNNISMVKGVSTDTGNIILIDPAYLLTTAIIACVGMFLTRIFERRGADGIRTALLSSTSLIALFDYIYRGNEEFSVLHMARGCVRRADVQDILSGDIPRR